MGSIFGINFWDEFLESIFGFDNQKRNDKSLTQSGNKKWESLVKPISNHFNGCHLGSQVLSMSKRIMNEVITTAEDLGIKIFYQDTDSMHILENDLIKLSEQYKQLYDRDLIGSNMGQFHNDFTLEGLNNIYSKELVILGKKSYIDLLEVNPIELYRLMAVGQEVQFDLTNNLTKKSFQITNDYFIKTREKFDRVLSF